MLVVSRCLDDKQPVIGGANEQPFLVQFTFTIHLNNTEIKKWSSAVGDAIAGVSVRHCLWWTLVHLKRDAVRCKLAATPAPTLAHHSLSSSAVQHCERYYGMKQGKYCTVHIVHMVGGERRTASGEQWVVSSSGRRSLAPTLACTGPVWSVPGR